MPFEFSVLKKGGLIWQVGTYIDDLDKVEDVVLRAQ
jgi:hypothetical protein